MIAWYECNDKKMNIKFIYNISNKLIVLDYSNEKKQNYFSGKRKNISLLSFYQY